MNRRRVLFLLGALSICNCQKRRSKEQMFQIIAGFAVPDEARSFRWEAENFDEFGDHDGVFTFSAPRGVLTSIVKSEFRPGSPWVKENDLYVVETYEKGLECRGIINENRGTFRLEYMTW